MANKYPYVASAGPLIKAVDHLKKSFPNELTADTLKKLGVAPKNESYVINVFRFLGVIDDEGNKVEGNVTAFFSEGKAFESEFAKLVQDAYAELFELYGEDAWSLDRGALTQFFRSTDYSSQVVGSRQAGTFSALSALSGHGEIPAAKPASARNQQRKSSNKDSSSAGSKKKPNNAKVSANVNRKGASEERSVGLTVRIEVNLPASGDQETYDRIFKSIRENLIDAS